MKKKRLYLINFIVILIIAAVVAFFWLPLPDYVEIPGDANNLKRMVSIDHHPNRNHGQLLMTSVGLAQASPATYCWAKVDPIDSVHSSQSVTGNQSNQLYDRVQRFYMRDAINAAIYNAFKNSHRYVRERYYGIYVVNVMKRSYLYRRLKIGDTITQINYHHFNNANGYQKYLTHLPRNSSVVISYRNRDHHSHIITTKLIRLPDHRRGLGVLLADNASVHVRVPVHIHTDKIGGPSGGLMFALQIYSQLNSLNLTKGCKIAGTGTINQDGQVGEIGGIDKKVIAAKNCGATVFFAPYVKPTKAVLSIEPDHLTNYQLAVKTAGKYAPHMKIVPVTNFRTALNYLKK